MLSPVFDDDLRFLERVEDFAVEQFVTEFRVEALAIAVFPWTARHDVGGFGTGCCDPLPECFGDELRAIAPTEGRTGATEGAMRAAFLLQACVFH